MARLTLRLPEETYARLKARQRLTGQSLNDLVVKAIDEALSKEPIDIADERQRVRAALGDLVMDIHPELWPASGQSAAEREKILASLPKLDPPLSRTIIEDREDRI